MFSDDHVYFGSWDVVRSLEDNNFVWAVSICGLSMVSMRNFRKRLVESNSKPIEHLTKPMVTMDGSTLSFTRVY